MFTELSTREEQYKSELGNGSYLTAAACPASPAPNGIDFNTTCVTGASPWVTLRVNPTDSAIRCPYAITTGLAGLDAGELRTVRCSADESRAQRRLVLDPRDV